MSMDKFAIEKNFGRASRTYDRHARVQKNMAQELAFRTAALGTNFKNILEIGCGTGFLTELLAVNYPEANILATDISGKMIEAARKKLSHFSNIAYLTADGEKLNLQGEFDLIVSSAVFQWFNDYSEPFEYYHQLLTPGGWLSFNTFGEGTFCELQEVLAELGISPGGNGFIKQHELNQCMTARGFGNCKVERKTIRDFSFSARELFLGIKKIGAHSFGYALKEGEIFKLTGLYKKLYCTDNQVFASYEVLYGSAQKL